MGSKAFASAVHSDTKEIMDSEVRATPGQKEEMEEATTRRFDVVNTGKM